MEVDTEACGSRKQMEVNGSQSRSVEVDMEVEGGRCTWNRYGSTWMEVNGSRWK